MAPPPAVATPCSTDLHASGVRLQYRHGLLARRPRPALPCTGHHLLRKLERRRHLFLVARGPASPSSSPAVTLTPCCCAPPATAPLPLAAPPRRCSSTSASAQNISVCAPACPGRCLLPPRGVNKVLASLPCERMYLVPLCSIAASADAFLRSRAAVMLYVDVRVDVVVWCYIGNYNVKMIRVLRPPNGRNCVGGLLPFVLPSSSSRHRPKDPCCRSKYH
jgi:hypothetical protein